MPRSIRSAICSSVKSGSRSGSAIGGSDFGLPFAMLPEIVALRAGPSSRDHASAGRSVKCIITVRQAAEPARDGLWRRIGELLGQFTPADCANYFRAAGYGESF